MKAGIRIIVCTVLIAVAVTMATFTVADFGARAQARTESAFVLGEQNGNVAVFAGSDRETPVTVTDIELASLRETDRALIRGGLSVGSREELMSLLEDLGS